MYIRDAVGGMPVPLLSDNISKSSKYLAKNEAVASLEPLQSLAVYIFVSHTQSNVYGVGIQSHISRSVHKKRREGERNQQRESKRKKTRGKSKSVHY